MTTAQIIESGNYTELHVTGHAGYNPGNDIVCSAISMLISAITFTAQQNGLACKYLLSEGDSWVVLRPLPGTELLVDMFKLSFNLLSKQYPDNVRVGWEK